MGKAYTSIHDALRDIKFEFAIPNVPPFFDGSNDFSWTQFESSFFKTRLGYSPISETEHDDALSELYRCLLGPALWFFEWRDSEDRYTNVWQALDELKKRFRTPSSCHAPSNKVYGCFH